MIFIKQFGELGSSDIDQAGGKGANLGELTRAGIPVPPGFVVTTEAYRVYVAEHQLDDRITALAAARDDPVGYEDASAQIRALFSDELSEALRTEIAEAYAALEEAPVAVRSSATAEDLPEASFAGQQDTYLNVRGLEDLLVAVRDCWASLWTARAMAYRARQGLDPATVSLAVVVQQMVNAEAAGVMFTANPSNGRRDETLISTAWGLGESVVSGAVNTDNFVIREPDGTVLSSVIADKAVMTVYAEQRTEERPVPADQRKRPVLSTTEAAELAAYGTRIENHYGAPQDIEWARADGKFWILQARPITALPEAAAAMPTDWTVPEPTAMYVRASIVEQLPDPLSPLFRRHDRRRGHPLAAKPVPRVPAGRRHRGERRWADDGQRVRLLPLHPFRHGPAHVEECASLSDALQRRNARSLAQLFPSALSPDCQRLDRAKHRRTQYR